MSDIQRGDADSAILLLILFVAAVFCAGEPDLWDKLMALLDHELSQRGIEL